MSYFAASLNHFWKDLNALWKPPPNLTISEWGDLHYVLPQKHGGGFWKTKPYQKGILDAISDPQIEKVTLMKSIRIGYTKMIDLSIGYFMDADPSSMLVVQPTEDDAEGFSRDELAPMLSDVPVLRGKVRREQNTLTQKDFPGGSIYLVGANAPTGFRRITVRIVFLDEVSSYPISAGTEGDPVRLAVGRSLGAFNRKIIAGSTPTVAGGCRIEKEFLRSDKRYLHVPCPHCSHYQILSWSHFQWPKGQPEKAHFTCIACRARIEESSKQSIVAQSQWRSLKNFICCDREQPPERWDARGNPICELCDKPHVSTHAGFHIWAAYSDLPNAAWAKLASEWETVKDNPEEKTAYINQIRGETFEENEIEVDWLPLHARREPYGPEYDFEVPEGVRVIVTGVDTQDSRLEALSVGFGANEECWLLSRKVFYGLPDDEETQAQLLTFLRKTYKHQSGFEMRSSACAVDIQGHFYDEMKKFCARHTDENMIAVRGGNDFSGASIRPPSIDKIEGIYVYTLGVNQLKVSLGRRLKYRHPGGKYLHFPKTDEFEADFFEQLTAENVVVKVKNGLRYLVYENLQKRRNEALDMLVYAYACLYIHNPDLSSVITNLAKSLDADDEEGDAYETAPSAWLN